MFDRYDPGTRRALALSIALCEAVEGGEVGADEVFAAIVLGPPSRGLLALQHQGVGAREALTPLSAAIGGRLSPDQIATMTAQLVETRADGSPPPSVPTHRFSNVVKQVLLQALRESQAMQDKHVGPEHVLLALTAMPGTATAAVDWTRLRADLVS